MVSDFVQKQVEDIREQDFKRLRELSIIVFSFTVAFFIYYLSTWWLVINYTLKMQRPLMLYLNYRIAAFAVSLIFLIVVVLYLWWLQNKPQFHVLFIEHKKNQAENNAKHHLYSYTSILISVVGITTGLSLFVLFDYFTPYPYIPYYWEYLYTAPNLFYLNGLISSLIVVACISVLLYIIYRIKPDPVQRILRWFLLIPIFLSIPTAGAMAWRGVAVFLGEHTEFAPAGVATAVFEPLYSNTLILASFIILLYLAYYINAGYGKFSTFVEEKHARTVIEEGVWILPRKVRAGTPHSAFLDLKLSSDFKKRPHGDCSYESSDCLEAEMQAIGIDVRDEGRVKICDTSPLPVTTWVYSFTQPGINSVNLKINMVRMPNNSRDVIFIHKHDVMVSNLLSISATPVLAFVTSIVVTVLKAII